MIELANKWAIVLLLLPLLVNRLAPAYRRQLSALKVPFFTRMAALSNSEPQLAAVVTQRSWLSWLSSCLIWACIVIAIARPQFIGAPIVQEKSARDLMVAVDLSGSMETKDFSDNLGNTTDRLTAVKSVLDEFVAQRPHDRLGLIVFGDAPFLQVPFTQDHDTWLTLLHETQIAMAGMSTAFGDAIGLAIKHFSNDDASNRVLIVLSDGNDTGSRVPPVEAAKVAKQYGVTIYPIAIGDPQTLGEEALDIETLQRVAEITGGSFYQALDRQDLQQIYRRIAELEPQLFDTQSFHPRTDLHQWPMGLATLLLMLSLVVGVIQRQVTTNKAVQ